MFTRIQTFAVIVLLAAGCFAQATAQEQLGQLTAQLQKTPTDNALRERIIKLAATTTPPPVVPDEALKFEGRAQFAIKKAASVADFLAAADEYQKAVAIAPWVGGYYSDLCTIYEKAERYADAKTNCGFYLLSLTDAAQINELKVKMAGFDYGIEQAAKAKAAAESPEVKEAAFMKSVEGARFVIHEDGKSWNFPMVFDQVFEIRQARLVLTMKVFAFQPPSDSPNITLRNGINRPGDFEIFNVEGRSRAYSYRFSNGESYTWTLADDAQSLIQQQTSPPDNFPKGFAFAPTPLTIKRQ